MGNIHDATRYLLQALEVDMYKTRREPYAGLMDLLAKLGIKSARLDNRPWGGALRIESLDAILKQATFDDKQLKNFKAIKPRRPCGGCPSNNCPTCPTKK